MVTATDRPAMARDEAHDLIASDRVEGTTVYNRQGEKLGTISKFMVGKRSGRVEYAVMGFGGLFGMGERDYPLPWNVLDYQPDKGGYVVDLDKDQLKDAPSFERGRDPAFDRDYGEQVYTFYGITY
jgi:hypothetical protein